VAASAGDLASNDSARHEDEADNGVGHEGELARLIRDPLTRDSQGNGASSTLAGSRA
jgi:hypothetical protein